MGSLLSLVSSRTQPAGAFTFMSLAFELVSVSLFVALMNTIQGSAMLRLTRSAYRLMVPRKPSSVMTRKRTLVQNGYTFTFGFTASAAGSASATASALAAPLPFPVPVPLPFALPSPSPACSLLVTSSAFSTLT